MLQINKLVVDLEKAKYKVFQRKLSNDFAAQRNFGLSMAKGDWVLYIDSDEVVTPQLADEIKRVVEIPNPPAGEAGSKSQIPMNGYFIKRKDFLFGKWLRYGETGNISLLRLAKKDTGKWMRPVHEVWDIKGQTDKLKTPILHFPHQNVAQFIDEINWYSTLNAKYLFDHGKKVYFWDLAGYPLAKFIRNYIFCLGFLDGTAGMVTALLMSFHSFLTRGKLWLLWHKKSEYS